MNNNYGNTAETRYSKSINKHTTACYVTGRQKSKDLRWRVREIQNKQFESIFTPTLEDLQVSNTSELFLPLQI